MSRDTAVRSAQAALLRACVEVLTLDRRRDMTRDEDLEYQRLAAIAARVADEALGDVALAHLLEVAVLRCHHCQPEQTRDHHDDAQ